MSARGPSDSPPSTSQDGLQPFQCLVCQKRFTRHENLKRHTALHAQRERDVTFPCAYCTTVSSRRDLRRRHVKRKHPEQPLPSAKDETQAPDAPVGNGSAGELNLPEPNVNFEDLFGNDVLGSLGGGHLSIEEILSGNSTTSAFSLDGDQQSHPDHDFAPPAALFDVSTLARPHLPVDPPPTYNRTATPHEIRIGVDLFFDNVGHCFPFLHRPTFDISTSPEVLLMGMLSLGMQYMDREDEGIRLAKTCFHRGRELLEADYLRDRIVSDLQLPAIQACLLLEMHAIMSTCGSETAYGLRIHTRCVELARIGGLAEPLPPVSTASDLESLWRQYVRLESHKRTFFALYQLDVMWYHILSIPRTISHLEIKLELPSSQAMWEAASSSDWAHRSLLDKTQDQVVRNQTPSRYIQAVRTCMSLDPPPCASKYDAHGSLLIILFLLSSVREQSGWSTMTGHVSFERFKALHSSLKTLEILMDLSEQGGAEVVCEATWHMSMIELLLWSPPHTNGVVEGSLDAALAAGTHLTVAQPIVMSGQVVESLESHLRFFLLYLHQTSQSEAARESPWVTIYCFKASLIAWQLIRAGVGDFAACIGVVDLKSMLEWIRNVFSLRSKWGVGRAVLKSLDELEAVSMV